MCNDKSLFSGNDEVNYEEGQGVKNETQKVHGDYVSIWSVRTRHNMIDMT